MTNQLTRIDFNKNIFKTDSWKFTEYRKYKDTTYRIEFLDSFIKCDISKTKEGVQIVYLDSEYKEDTHKINLIAYATFIIAYRLNKNKGFETVTFEKSM